MRMVVAMHSVIALILSSTLLLVDAQNGQRNRLMRQNGQRRRALQSGATCTVTGPPCNPGLTCTCARRLQEDLTLAQQPASTAENTTGDGRRLFGAPVGTCLVEGMEQ